MLSAVSKLDTVIMEKVMSISIAVSFHVMRRPISSTVDRYSRSL